MLVGIVKLALSSKRENHHFSCYAPVDRYTAHRLRNPFCRQDY
jgi:hypothetical protein